MYIHRQTVAPVQTPLLQWPCQPTFLKALILLLFFYLCALRLSADNSELMQHTDLLKVINISISFGAVIIICLFRNVQVDTTSSILVLFLSPCLLSFELDCVFFIRGAKNCHCGLSSGLKTPCSIHIYTLLIQKEWQHTANSISPALCLRVCVRLCSSGDYLTWHLFIYHVPFHQQGLMHIPQVEAKREMLTGIFTLISIMIIVQAWCLEIISSEKEIMLLTL